MTDADESDRVGMSLGEQARETQKKPNFLGL
jgi:hypothetical protein